MSSRSFIIILVAMQSCISSLHAQYNDHRNRQLDSLELVLQLGQSTDIELLGIYGELMEGYSYLDNKKAVNYAQKGAAISERIDNLFGIPYFNTHIGMLHYGNSQYDSAMVYYEKALQGAELMKIGRNSKGEPFTERNVDNQYSKIYGSIANLYNIQGQYSEAIEYYTKALKIFEKHSWKESQSIAYSNIGELYMSMGNYEQAENNFTKMNIIAYELNDSLIIMYADKGLSALYLAQGEYDTALKHAEAVHNYIFTHSEEGEDSKVFVYNLLAEIYLSGKNNVERAEDFVKQALLIDDTTLITPRERAVSLRLLSDIHLQCNQWRQAEQTAHKALATDDSEPANTLSLYRILAKTYSYLGNAAKTEEYIDKMEKLQSSWSTKHYQSAIREMEVKYETAKKETRITTLEEEKRLIMWLGIASGAVLLLMLALFLFLWRLNVQKKRVAQQKHQLAEQQVKQLEQEKQLVATQALLDGETQERTRLARDLHDGLGGMLSATRLNLDDMKKDMSMNEKDAARFDKAMGMLDNSMTEMRRVAHHLMPDSLSRFGLKTALTDFCNSIPIAEFNYFGDGRRFDAKCEAVIYHIAHELINNALKHSGASHIIVQIVQDTDRLSLTVEDNGRGFDIKEATSGIGLANVRTRVVSMGGILDLRSSVETGTEINIEFQLA